MLDEPPRGGFLTPDLFALSGREILDEAIAGRLPAPPLSHLTGVRPTAIGDGTSEFVMPASGWLATGFGPVPAGMLAVLADAPLSGAIQSTIPPGVRYTTTELALSYLRPAQPDGRLLTGTGRLLHRGRSLALSDTEVRDADGRLLAHCTSRCFLFPPVEVPRERPAPRDVPAYDTPDPWQREPTGALVDLSVVERMSGLEQWRAWAAGDLPLPPIAHLTGGRPVRADEGEVEWRLPATRWLCSPTGYVQGGVIAYIADAAVVSAAATLAPAGTGYTQVDLTVKYVRPVPPDGRELVARGTVVHAGRTLVVATAHVVNGDGKLVATAMGSAMLLPGRIAAMRRPVAVEDEPAGV